MKGFYLQMENERMLIENERILIENERKSIENEKVLIENERTQLSSVIICLINFNGNCQYYDGTAP